ncbi:MAG TPA: glycoside hydrolase family 130 protein [Jatrophihabitantaceae bacterium]|jgi:predicted GH43/DUF377 family glycosyl hydrolase|nr:glycoside hydrolase family 130 protein [Jatrophihabitantaceae bacterium]
MDAIPLTVQRVEAMLNPDPSRVIARLFLPGEELTAGRSRSAAVVERVLALPEAEVEEIAASLIGDYGDRHRNYAAMLIEHACLVSSHPPDGPLPVGGRAPRLSPARTLLLGASFTAEYAVEGAALCNPSAVLAPDQSGLAAGQSRVALSLRGVGEGHLSSIGFATAIAGPGADWEFEPRPLPAVAGVSTAGRPARRRAAEVPPGPVAPAYRVSFPPDVSLGQRVLLPSVAEESNGMEDARFVLFTDADGVAEYRATYTAYDGSHIASRLLTSPDLRQFQAHRLTGPGARNKGMALFPRLVGGRQLALCRSDGERTFLSASGDGFDWGEAELVQSPQASWELLQVGNGGPPIETDRGWLVLTHGVGPMRRYSIGAVLLDLEQPARVIGRLPAPLLAPDAAERDGYVPNVVYSCGSFVHDGRLWLPYGIGDARIAVGWVLLEELLDRMSA